MKGQGAADPKAEGSPSQICVHETMPRLSGLGRNVDVDGAAPPTPAPPAVPSIQRRSRSFQRNEAIVTGTTSSATSATDEFGFPLPQRAKARSSSSLPYVRMAQSRAELEGVGRPGRLQQQTRGHSIQQQRRRNGDGAQQFQSQTQAGELPPVAVHRRSDSASSSVASAMPPAPKIRRYPPRGNSHATAVARQPSSQSAASSSRSKSSNPRSRKKALPRVTVSRPDPARYRNHTFQHPANAMRLAIRTVDLAHRVAFDARMPSASSSASLRRMLEEMDRVRGSRSAVGSVIETDGRRRSGDNPCRISPSPGHVAILEFMHRGTGQPVTGREGRRVVRQLQWNAACSIDADPWFDVSYYEGEGSADSGSSAEQDTKSVQDQKSVTLDRSSDGGTKQPRDAVRTRRPMCRKPKSGHWDGRYVPVDPLSTTRSVLPNHSPLLTNVKQRLPMRSDVGFANPSPVEVQRKMEEVKREVEWEEASPRIVLLGSGFSLFSEEDDEIDELHPSCRADAMLWATGSVPGVPFAGRDLVSSYKMAAKFKQIDSGELDSKKQAAGAINLRAYSVFAPPVDATFSASHLWRPRPFADRPPGFAYFLACPLDVRFGSGDVEPLFCTMALYMLPKEPALSRLLDQGFNDENTNASNAFCGKISEDFFFPAGDWNAVDGLGGTVDDDDEDDDDKLMQQSWRRRKRRAIMSYDPLEVSSEDLHLVIQVFRAVRPDESEVPNNSTNQSKKKIGSKIKRSLLTGKSRDKNHATIESLQLVYQPNEDLPNDPLASFEEVGVQHLTPMCFSVTPAFGTGSAREKQESAPLFGFPGVPESQEEFVARLASLSNSAQSDAAMKPVPISGYTDVFTSHLGGDFTRALLDDPPQLHKTLEDAAPVGPQLLADVSGDCAISFDGPTSADGAERRRSRLRRLPQSRESGYSSSFDLREVLYLPPRSPTRRYEDDAALCVSAVLNLLYVYPRLIRWSSGRVDGERLSLRVQVVEQELPPDQSFDSSDPTYRALRAVYNPSSPAGPPLVESFFTKLAVQSGDDRGDRRDDRARGGRRGIPLRDEIKIRLPDILDRRHFLQFSLFSVRGCADTKPVVKTTIPFIISSKESTSGGRVTTIIPNGLHRIQLGDGLQIHVETRLASSSHVSDPSVATLLRDYPIVTGTTEPGGSGGSIGDKVDSASSNVDVVVHAPSGLPFLDILTMASGQAVKRHFACLVTAGMLNLVNGGCPTFYFESLFLFGSDAAWHRLVAWEKTDHLLAVVLGLFEILDKTRTSYQERDRSMMSPQYHRLVKSFLDTFDEPLFAQRRPVTESRFLENGDTVGGGHLDDSLDSAHGLNESSYHDDPPPASDVSKEDPRARVPKYQVASPRNNISPRSFSRRAFVATRSEQLRAEAELNDDDNAYGREYFDDDETVATFGTTASRIDSGSIFPVILETRSFGFGAQDGTLQAKDPAAGGQGVAPRDWTCGSGIVQSNPGRSPTKPSSSTPFSFASKRAEYMANRVAQLALAPCMAPSVDEVDGTPRHSANGSSGNGILRVTNNIASYGTTANRSPFEPSSDAEEEGEMANTSHHLRGNQSCLKIPPLIFHPMRDSDDFSISGDNISKSNTPYLYEIILVLWVQAWTSFASSVKGDTQVQGSGNIIPIWPYELVQGSQNPTSDALVAFSFIRHMSFFLPLCLKSLGLRCAQHKTTRLIVPMTFLDDSHMHVLLPFVETVGLGLMREATSGSSGIANSDQMLMKALSNSDSVLDFFIGLFALLHPSQVSTLLLAYFNILEESEDPTLKESNVLENMNKNHLRRSKCARQIRLHAVERLAAIPTFARLNFPLKFTGSYPKRKVQITNDGPEEDTFRKYWESADRFPRSFWLSELLMNQCLSICKSSCDTIIIEAKKQSKALKIGSRADDAMLRDDLLRMESLAFHSILCAYELLVKRQAMDSRFQSIASSTRMAALFTRIFLQQSVDAASRLSRMDPDQKVRLIWLLCLLYILQEGPDAMIRNELRQFCNPEDNRIISFVRLLKLASTSCQHFIPGVESFPVLGGLAKEMTQEAFNCLSASAILLIDECFGVVSEDEFSLEQLGKYMFNLFLHLLSTPQSSVTLLRTLGGSAHALDKFGVVIFLKTVGNQLQHWGRIILTMMNSKELSVRSMAVDFFVSLLCDIFQEEGSIDSFSLCVLSVSSEVVAREIALCNMSGLIQSMADAESSVWPLRRALADVEETNPFDDDRVDPQLLPSLTTLCQTGQAIIDGVLVEMRLRCSTNLDLDEIVKAQLFNPGTGFRQLRNLPLKSVFDADEESVLEAASFFAPESGLTQKLRWLYTLRDLHVTKKQWSEVAESLILCAHSIIQSLDHLSTMWRPSEFNLWTDRQRAPWLSSIGLSDADAHCSRGNVAVMRFAHAFLDPGVFTQQKDQAAQTIMSVEGVCRLLITVIDQVEAAYIEEGGMEDIACSHLEELLTMITVTLNNESKRYHEGTRALQRVRAHVCTKLAKLTEHDDGRNLAMNRAECAGAQIYIQVTLHGNKPERFKESTTIPTYFEWDIPSICRVSMPELMAAARTKQKSPEESWEECICQTFAKPLIEALSNDDAQHPIVLRTRESHDVATNDNETCISVNVVQKKSSIKSRKFFVRHGPGIVTEYTVAHKFPHALSRQRTLITSEIKVPGQK